MILAHDLIDAVAGMRGRDHGHNQDEHGLFGSKNHEIHRVITRRDTGNEERNE